MERNGEEGKGKESGLDWKGVDRKGTEGTGWERKGTAIGLDWKGMERIGKERKGKERKGEERLEERIFKQLTGGEIDEK